MEHDSGPAKSKTGLKSRSLSILFILATLVLIGSGLQQFLPGPQRSPGNLPGNPAGSGTPNLLFTPLTDQGVPNPVVTIAQSVSPAVVGIINQQPGGFLSPGGEDASGSGVVFDKANGYIVTNNHVVQGASRILVILADGRELSAELVGRDPYTDLAVLQVQAPDLVAAGFGDSEQVNVGETAVAIGNPLGIKFARSVTVGVISGLNRQLTTEEGNAYQLIQTDAAINPGNSGGALVNVKGEIIGINTVKIAIPGFEGMGFAIPINQVKTVIDSLIKEKQVVRPALGIKLVGEVTVESAAYYQLPVDYGVVIEVHRAGPADKAGLLDLDIIVAADGQVVQTAAELHSLIAQHQVGDTISVKLFRQSSPLSSQYQEMTIPVTLGRLSTPG